jgi:hypothetical protein
MSDKNQIDLNSDINNINEIYNYNNFLLNSSGMIS